MADGEQPGTSAPAGGAPAAAPAAAPSPAPAPAPAPAAPVEAAPAPAPAPAPVPKVETPAAAASADHAAEPTLLETLVGREPAKPEEKPAVVEEPAKPAETPAEAKPAEGTEKPKAEAAKPGEPAKPAETPKPAPVKYETFALPEGIKATDEQIAEFTGIIGPLQVPQTEGQRLLDLYGAGMKRYAEGLREDQHRVFAETRRTWRTELAADEEMGGSALNTTKAAVARMRDLFVPPERAQAFNDMLRVTGVGDHPEFWRLLYTAARYFDEPTLPPPNYSPTRDNGAPNGRGRLRDMYRQTRAQRGA